MSERLHCGRLSASIADVVDSGFELLPNFEMAAITLLEGAERPAEWPTIRRRLRSEGIRAQSLRGVIMLEPGELERFSELGLFRGLDELFIMPDWDDEFEPFPGRVSSDIQCFNEGSPLGLEEWMMDAGCLLALGDGSGLNFATFDKKLATMLKDHFQTANA